MEQSRAPSFIQIQCRDPFGRSILADDDKLRDDMPQLDLRVQCSLCSVGPEASDYWQ
jgi:hypothetical protein